MLVSGYQAIDMYRIVLPVKFNGGLSISVLRNKQLLKKVEVKKFKILIFNSRHLKKDGQNHFVCAEFCEQ
jgi:hypothetical protein